MGVGMGDGFLTRWQGDPLSALLGTENSAMFLDVIFERDFCLSRAPATDRFAGLVTLADVDRIVTGTDLKDGDIVLANAGSGHTDAGAYVDGGGFIDRAAIARFYREGATVIVNQAQRFLPALGQLCQGMEHIFSCHVQTNLYLTPPGQQGFATHFDNHDVFVIQVEGEKAWRLLGVPLDLPFRGEKFDSTAHASGELREEFTLHAGDCLYVPRGMMHDAATSGDAPSLHITVGLINKTWADLLLEAVAEAALRLPDLRSSLPPGFARGDFDRTAARTTLTNLLQQLAANVTLDPALDLLIDQHIRSRAALNAGSLMDRARPIAPDEPLVRVAEAAARLAREGDGWCLIVPGGDADFPAEAGAVLARAVGGGACTLAELCVVAGGQMSDDAVEDLTRRLMDYGLLRRAAMGN